MSGRQERKRESVKWDEDNIRETFHPADKDYGHIKIDEPNTPYEPPLDMDDEDDFPDLDLGGYEAVASFVPSHSSDLPEDEFENEQTQTKSHINFVKKRKNHYNMREAMRKARQLLQEEEEEEEEKEEKEKDQIEEEKSGKGRLSDQGDNNNKG
eukprot:gene10219-2375_t